MSSIVRPIIRPPQLPSDTAELPTDPDGRMAWGAYEFSLNRWCFLLTELLNGSAGTGSVTEVDTTLPITGGPITTIGTIGINNFVASGASHFRGAVPDPGAAAGTTKFLREDASWAVPPGAGLTSPLTTKGDIWGFSTLDARIPVGGINGQILTVDSTQALGVKWAANAALPSVFDWGKAICAARAWY